MASWGKPGRACEAVDWNQYSWLGRVYTPLCVHGCDASGNSHAVKVNPTFLVKLMTFRLYLSVMMRIVDPRNVDMGKNK